MKVARVRSGDTVVEFDRVLAAATKWPLDRRTSVKIALMSVH